MATLPATPRALVVLGASAALALSACGSASTPDSSNPGASGGVVSASGTASVGAADTDVVSDYVAYVGGKAGAADPSKKPISLGWVNIEGGAVGPTPEATKGAQAAVKYINDSLGGIGGHPLELKVCTITTAEEEGQKCGQQMLNDDSVQAVAAGNMFLGDTSFNSVLSGAKPVVVGVATGASMPTAKNAYILFGDLTHVFAPFGTYARDVLKAKTASLLYTNVPGDKAAGAAVREGLEAAGVKVTAVGYDAAATDLLGPVTAAGAQAADVVVPIGRGQGCIAIAKALNQLGVKKPVVATPVCLSPDVAQGLGGDLPTWTYGIAQTLPNDASAVDSKAYLEASAKAGLDPKDAGLVFAAVSWSQILTYAKVFNAIGPDKITAAAVSEQLKSFTGPVAMGAPEVKCGQFSDAPAVCNSLAKFYTYQGKGAFVPAAGWMRPPA